MKGCELSALGRVFNSRRGCDFNCIFALFISKTAQLKVASSAQAWSSMLSHTGKPELRLVLPSVDAMESCLNIERIS